MNKNYRWSNPYYGVAHYSTGVVDSQYGRRWATIQTVAPDCHDLLLWFPGCGFSPAKETFGTAAEARARGEAWTKND